MSISRRRAWVLAVAGTIAAANVAHAATTDELEQRLDRMEQMLQQTRAELAQQKQATEKAQQDAEAARQASMQRQTPANSSATQVASQSSASQTPAAQRAAKKPGTFQIGANTTAELGGYLKADTIYSHVNNGSLSARAKDFYINGAIPVGPDATRSTDDVNFTARQTRLNLTTLTNLDGHKIKGYVEADFYGDNDSASSVTHGYQPRLRHAYIEVDDSYLFGQTWSNFMDLGAYPETLDFVGPNEGQVFIRNPQVRYTRNGFSASIEDPASEIDPTVNASNSGDDQHYPDLTLAYTMPTSFGHLAGGFLGKAVSTDTVDDANGQPVGNDTQFGYGFRLSGSIDDITAAGDNLKFQAYYGDGIGRYVALGTVQAGYIKGNGDVETLSAFGGYLDYQHNWSAHWRSNLVLGALEADNPSDYRDFRTVGGNASGSPTKRVDSVHANLLWNPLDPLTLGGEYLFARRSLENGYDGNLNRVEFSAKYAF